MSTLTIAAPVTPQDLLHLPDAVRFELVDGKLVERKMGMESSEIAARIVGLLMLFLRDHAVGRLYGADASYQCFVGSPDKVRKPDVSFIRSGRLPGDRSPKGHCPIPPDLAVEVISPGDLAYEVEEKVAEYLAAGVPLVWVVTPPTRRVRVYRTQPQPRGSVIELALGDAISGEDVLPGFSCPVAHFFE
ncbi:MAG TPA: Uma2 family endonuclease [Tepidisphaeraceae bacterium]|jgi:Uma2 family endonuclease|nr:Uma2 family endonuclease [Tepidisphaeraceae bacterium]